MNSKVSTAVILAAGLGSRLKHHTQAQPKGFLEIDGMSLIERSINALLRAGFKEVIIGTGYLHEHFEGLKKKYPVRTLRNDDYSVTGSMYTLYLLRDIVKAPFLLLESDLLYDPEAITHLQKDPLEDIILASGATQSGDEVFIQASENSTLQQMSKNPSTLRHISGELVGISKLSVDTLNRMSSFAEQTFGNNNRMMNYEDAMVGVADQHPIHVKVVDDLVWCEIDDENHLQRALTSIYPKIKHKISNR